MFKPPLKLMVIKAITLKSNNCFYKYHKKTPLFLSKNGVVNFISAKGVIAE
jgi:hypothetical protein